MNIFYVHENPKIAAQSLCDSHVVKMILESCQMLSTAHRVLDGVETAGKSKSGRNVKRWILNDNRENVLYLACHINHPSSKWVRESIGNYNWLFEHMHELCMEYTYRYNKKHKCFGNLSSLLYSPPFNLKELEMTTIPCAIPNEFIISDDAVENYRNYYVNGKKHLHKWKRREPPEWIKIMD